MSHRLYVKELIKRDTTAGTPGKEKRGGGNRWLVDNLL